MPSDIPVISSFHPFFSAYLVYIRKRSPAKMEASSPPVPARISIMAFLLSWGSAGISRNLIFCSISGICSSSCATSSLANSRISSSFSVSRSSLALAKLPMAFLYFSPAWIIGPISAYSLFRIMYRFISCTSEGSDNCCCSVSYFLRIPSSFFSNEFSGIFIL